MPWTFAHPAAVLPLRPLRALPFGALVAGSCVPDLGYYVDRMELAGLAHTAPGLVLVCLPAGLVVFALARFLHRPVASLLPEPHRGALLGIAHAARFSSVSALAALALAVIAGAATHNAWDSFTHPGGFVVLRAPLLRATALRLGSYPVPVYQLLQHASTALGLVLLSVAYWRWIGAAARAAGSAAAAANARRWRRLALLAVAAGLAGMLVALASASAAGAGLRVLVFRGAVCATTAFVVSLCVVALLLYPRSRES